MAVPTHVKQFAWFYPLGDTLASSLTRDLPSEGDADILCLGCGDIHHILYTSHEEPDRVLNISCVDTEPHAIARNVLALTLILDGTCEWEMLYHTKISSESLKVIQAQAKVLQNTDFNGRIQFADYGTLERVKKIWKSYEITPEFSDASRMRAVFADTKNNSTSLKSSVPCHVKAKAVLWKLHGRFWKDGTLDKVSGLNNPLFHSIDSVIHYDTDPLHGYHLAAAFAATDRAPVGAFNLAKTQFLLWIKSFRGSKTSVKYCWADALAYCHAIQGIPTYRANNSLVPLELAPGTFDVIDTSTLSGELGVLNILTATTPIIRSGGIIRMEYLMFRQQGLTWINELLNGDLNTISSLLGLYLLEDGIKASAAPTTDMLGISPLQDCSNGDPIIHRLQLRLTWKAGSRIKLKAEHLSYILHSVYDTMFQDEGPLEELKTEDAAKNLSQDIAPFLHHHRGSFVHLLRVMQASSNNWRLTMERLLQLIEGPGDDIYNERYLAELRVWLHRFGLHTADIMDIGLQISMDHNEARLPKGTGFVWLTVKIPRSCISKFTGPSSWELGMLLVLCKLEWPEKHFFSRFASVNLAFGKIQATGPPGEQVVHIEEDDKGWKGSSDLLAVFCAPWMLLFAGLDTIIGFGLQHTRNAAKHGLSNNFGNDLMIFETTLKNASRVYITKDPPNMASSSGSIIPVPDRGMVAATVNGTELRETTIRCDLDDDTEKEALFAGATVTATQVTPWEFEVCFGSFKKTMIFPCPVMASKCKTRIARKSGYLELCGAPKNYQDCSAMNPFPLRSTPGGLELMNLSRLQLSGLPKLNLNGDTDWLVAHLVRMFTAKETATPRLSMAIIPEHYSPRFAFRNTLQHLYMLSLGRDGAKEPCKVLALKEATLDGRDILILIDSLRIHNSDHTVVMDVAILPISTEIIALGLDTLSIVPRKAYHEKALHSKHLNLWKEVLPAYVERCRTWSHTDSCEYQSQGIPVTKKRHMDFLCSCGKGKFPDDYLKDISGFEKLKPHCTRAAVSLCFPVHYVKE